MNPAVHKLTLAFLVAIGSCAYLALVLRDPTCQSTVTPMYVGALLLIGWVTRRWS